MRAASGSALPRPVPSASRASKTRSISRAQPCARFPATGARRRSRAISSKPRSTRSPPRSVRALARPASRRDDGRHRPGARQRARRRGRRRNAVLGRGHATLDREPPPRPRAGRQTARSRRLATLEESARAMAGAMDFGFPRPRAQAALDRLPRCRRPARPELLRSARLRGAPRELRGDRQGRRRVAALVPPRARRHPDRPWRGAHLLVGIDVRVPDAVARHARAGREPPRADQPPGGAPADRLRRRARRALGRLGVGLQRARPRAHLPVFELRHSGLGPEARAGRERRHRAYATALAAMVDPGAAARISPGSQPPARSGATASTRRSTTRRRVCPRGRRSRWCGPSWPTTRA